ncbi:hypothetical protein AAFF_G00253020 [Aldrovandia affinis]|uniref:Uncharacterized protein n=1 Tax=Aldrovandia affinis TaxID=143900 RepID=A0AAD7SV06_9TELE|nr:hypothetical protein AAFF_G00253020 [Aldrovandia affinis]
MNNIVGTESRESLSQHSVQAGVRRTRSLRSGPAHTGWTEQAGVCEQQGQLWEISGLSTLVSSQARLDRPQSTRQVCSPVHIVYTGVQVRLHWRLGEGSQQG